MIAWRNWTHRQTKKAYADMLELMNSTIRVKATNNQWRALPCSVIERDNGTVISVPSLNGTWMIHPEGMIANLGGNDWRIYALHPDETRDCLFF